jgi:biopolymer transport protein ExbB/TolQ
MSDIATYLPAGVGLWPERVRRLLPDSVLRWLALPRLLSTMLFDGPSWAVGLLAVLLFYGVVNTWLLRQLEHDYASRILPELDADQTFEEQAVNRLLRRLELSASNPTLRNRLHEVLTLGLRRPASAHFVTLVEQLAGQPGESAQQQRLRDLIHDEFTGSASGIRLLVLTVQPTTGEKVVAAIEDIDRPAANILQDPANAEARRLLVRFGDVAAQELNPSLRALARYNGWVQWLTVLLAFAVITMAARRALAAYRRCSGQAASLADPDWRSVQRELHDADSTEEDPLDRRRSLAVHLQKQLDEGPYASLGFLLGLLPSLGFIGTVWGMGGALLQAEGLFTSADKQEVIHRITDQLGFAFDTTLVALAAGMISGTVVVAVRAWELNILRRLEAEVPELGASPLEATIV